MAVSRDDLFRDALRLDHHDRADLAKMLIDSLDPATEQDVEEVWMREIDRRAAELDADAAETIPWETVRERLGRIQSRTMSDRQRPERHASARSDRDGFE